MRGQLEEASTSKETLLKEHEAAIEAHQAEKDQILFEKEEEIKAKAAQVDLHTEQLSKLQEDHETAVSSQKELIE